jgi:hypothetical protein
MSKDLAEKYDFKIIIWSDDAGVAFYRVIQTSVLSINNVV